MKGRAWRTNTIQRWNILKISGLRRTQIVVVRWWNMCIALIHNNVQKNVYQHYSTFNSMYPVAKFAGRFFFFHFTFHSVNACIPYTICICGWMSHQIENRNAVATLDERIKRQTNIAICLRHFHMYNICSISWCHTAIWKTLCLYTYNRTKCINFSPRTLFDVVAHDWITSNKNVNHK